MKVCFLGEATKKHVRDWAVWLHKQGVEVVVLSDAKGEPIRVGDSEVRQMHPRWTFFHNVWTFKLRGGPLANNRDKWRLYRPMIEACNADLIHAHEALGYGPILPKLRTSVPTILTPWGPDVESAIQEKTTEKARLVLGGLQAADVITTNANGLESYWSDELGIPKERFRFFPWGVNTELFCPADSAQKDLLLQQWLIPEEALLFLCPRIPLPLYRHEDLLNGWRIFRERQPNVRAHLLFLSGGFPIPKSWNATDLKDFTWIEQNCAAGEMVELYQMADFTVMIPQTDLLAQSLLECLSCGSIPILNRLATYEYAVGDVDNNGLGRCIWVRDGITLAEQVADAFSAASAMTLSERANHSEHNIRIARSRFHEDICRRSLLELYEELLKKPR